MRGRICAQLTGLGWTVCLQETVYRRVEKFDGLKRARRFPTLAALPSTHMEAHNPLNSGSWGSIALLWLPQHTQAYMQAKDPYI